MKKIRVLQITNGFAVEGPLGGVERFGIELACALGAASLSDEQTETELCVEPILSGLWLWGTEHEAVWQQHVEAHGVRAIIGPHKEEQQPYANFTDAVRSLRRAIDSSVELPIDILHSHSEFGDVAALWLRRALGARAVVRTVHNEREWPRRPLRRRLLTQTAYPLLFDAELGVSQQVVNNLNRRPLAQAWRRASGKRPAQVMHNALNFERFAERGDGVGLRAELGIPIDAPLVGSVGRLTAQKDYSTLLQAAARVLSTRPDVYFVIVGDGEERNSLLTQAHEQGLTSRVIFAGPRRDVERFFAALNLFVSSSRWEGLPTVILEAMAASVPVVATSVSGSSELIVDGERGRLVPPGDGEALAEAVLASLRALSAAREMAVQAERYARSRFSIQSVARAHVRLYQQLMR